MASDFEAWLSKRLRELSADDEVYSPYIVSILEGDEDEADKHESLSDLLAGLGLDDGLPDPCQRLETEVWTRFFSNSASSQPEVQVCLPSTAKAAGGLGAALATFAEDKTKAYNSNKSLSKSDSDKDKKDREALKAAILAQYNNVVEESSEDEDEEKEAGEAEKNTNAEAVMKAQQELKEKSRLAAVAKKEKDKEDREKQKKDQEDRKKKAQEKSAKGERRR